MFRMYRCSRFVCDKAQHSQMSSGSALSVLYPRDDGRLELAAATVQQIFCSPETGDLPAAIISVAGAMRTGKSFLLDYLVRRLTESGSKGSPSGSTGSISGFPWRSGMSRHTSGIHIYSEPIIVNGVAVYLMDTQGTFDHRTTVRDNMTIFALASLTSSHLIYNIMHHIREDHLQNLQLFTEYGRLAATTSHTKPFQRLLFLVRDWQFPTDADFGLDGGRTLLNSVMQSKDGIQDLESLREHISSSFQSLDCFLLPYPGQSIAEDSKDHQQILDVRFKKHLDDLCNSILAPSNLIPKEIGGRVVKSREMYDYFLKYIEIFTGDSLPEPKSIYDTTAHLVYMHSLRESRDAYESKLTDYLSSSNHEPKVHEDLVKFHNKIQKLCLRMFCETAKFGDERKRKSFEATLEDDISKYFATIEKLNHSKILNYFHRARDVYTEGMDGLFKGEGALHIQDLHTAHKESEVRAGLAFKNSQSIPFSADLNAKLKTFLSDKFSDYEALNQARIQVNFQKYQESCILEYSRIMEEVLEGPFSINTVKLEYEHKAAKELVLKKLSGMESFGSNLLKDTEIRLDKALEEKATQFRDVNENKFMTNRVKTTVKLLSDNESYRRIWKDEKTRRAVVSSVLVVAIIRIYIGM